MNSNSKGFAQFIIILAGTLVVILAIGFFAFKNGQIRTSHSQKSLLALTPTPNIYPSEDTILPENIKSTIYKKEFYSIQLPNTWKQDPKQSDRYITSRSTNQKGEGDFTPGFAAIEVHITKLPAPENDFNPELKVREDINFKGYSGIKETGYQGVAGTVCTINIHVNANNLRYFVSLTTQDEELKNVFIQEFNQILSTLKFLE